VAVTRAQLRLYVIGDREAWSRAGFFAELARRLDSSPAQSGQSLLRLL
jgi:ATP-dependent exoDNAse (exonuclease V) alpha subunit